MRARRRHAAVARSADGMTIGTPIAVVMDGRDAMLAVGMNGEPLPLEHGFPVRLVVPGSLRLRVGHQVAGRPGADHASTAPRPTGRARLGREGADQDDVADRHARGRSTQGRRRPGRGRRCRVGAAPRDRAGRGAGRRRRLAARPGSPTCPGRHLAAVGLALGRPTRCAHPRGAARPTATAMTQPERQRDPFPSGATGWHAVTVRVV